jgi:hypothetical protein
VKRVLALTKDISQAFFIDIFAYGVKTSSGVKRQDRYTNKHTTTRVKLANTWCKEKPEEIMKKQGYHNGKTSVPK